MELARNRNDWRRQYCRLWTRLKTEFPQSPWLAEALFSSGNMYLLRKDYAQRGQLLRLSGDALPIE